MMLEGRRLWFWTGLLLIVAATAGCVVFLFYSRDRDSAKTLVSTLVAVVTAAAGATARLWTRARPPPRLPLQRAADQLAEQLRLQWERAAAERGLISPAPIPVQWRWSPRQVTGPTAEAVRGGFAPLPGIAAVTVEDLQSGALKDLLSVYGGLGSGRLIILGEPGAGKSSAGIRLLRDALAHRATVTAKDRARVPVPVLVTPHGWDPTTEPLTEWLAARLARDYALLRAPEYGANTVIDLIQGDHLAVILDGLDEMPETLRSVALRALNEQATFRLVVLSRSKELVAAVSSDHLRGAAALELLPTGPGQAAEYLASCQTDPPPAPWQHVIDHLHQHPDGVLAQALSTPLTLTLVRDTYGPAEGVDELIDVDGHRFGSAQAIEDHLLDRVLTAAYAHHPGRPDPKYTVDQARRWWGQLARRMNEEGTRDLTWWQIPRWVPVWPRVLVTVLVMSVVSALLVGSLSELAVHLHLFSALTVGSLTALVAIFGGTLGYSFMFGAGLRLMSPSGGGSLQQEGRLRWSRTDVLIILLLGLGVGFGLGLERGLVYGLIAGLLYGFKCSFVVGLGFILSGGPPQQLGRLRWNRTDTRTNLLTGLVVGLVAGLVVSLDPSLMDGLVAGLAPGFIAGIGYMLVIVLGGRPSPLPRSRIPTLTTLLVGFLIAIGSVAGYGIVYVLIVILCGRSPQQRSRLRWSRTDTPTTLLTGLVAGLVAGLVLGLVYGLVYGIPGGLVDGLLTGLVFGLTAALLLGLRQPPTEATSPLDPRSLWRRERQSGLVFGLVFGLMFGLAASLEYGLVYGPVDGLAYGLVFGLVVGLGSGLVSSATWATALASAQLRRRIETPVRLLPFLDDAHERQILRTVGPMYQFRHARLQDRLAEECETVPGRIP